MALAALKNELDTWYAALEAYDCDDFNGALSLFEVNVLTFAVQSLCSVKISSKFLIISRL